MARVIVHGEDPGEVAGWFELKPVSVLTADHQDEYFDLQAELREVKRTLTPPAIPENPSMAVAGAEEAPVRLTRRELFPVYALVIGWVLEGNSYGVALPWTPEERGKLPLPAWNTLSDALDAYFGSLNGEVPKEKKATSTGGSGSTSSDG